MNKYALITAFEWFSLSVDEYNVSLGTTWAERVPDATQRHRRFSLD